MNFGAFVTESSGHLSEYLPYYRVRAEGRRLLGEGYDGESGFYASGWPQWRVDADRRRAALVAGDERIDGRRSWEYASWIIEAREKDAPFRLHGNVANRDRAGGGRLISNLPADACVEVACLADRRGVTPTRHGPLPATMAHVCASNIAMQDLCATAAIERSREAAIHALMLDPLTAASLTPSEIRAMTEELFTAEAEWLPGFS